MTRLLLASVGLAVVMGAQSALADVNVLANINKTKDVTIIENITVVKDVILNVQVTSAPTKFAEADALTNQTNTQQLGCYNCAEKRDEITGTGNDNSGLLSINQTSGNMNNQGNTVAISVDLRVTTGTPPVVDPPGDIGFAEAQAGATQINDGNSNRSGNLFFREGAITDTLVGGNGVLHINQAPGNLNNQTNTLAMAVSYAVGGVALSEADLGQFNRGNTAFEGAIGQDNPETPDVNEAVGVHRSASITGSINGTSGIVGVNQAVGNLANQANIVSFAAVILP